jgi:hypothetical protein
VAADNTAEAGLRHACRKYCQHPILRTVEIGTIHTNPKRKRGNDLTPSLALRVSVSRRKCGPYIEGSIPINPFNNSSAVVILKGNTQPTGPTGSADGWQYNPANGWFYPNNSEYFQETGSFSDPN